MFKMCFKINYLALRAKLFLTVVAERDCTRGSTLFYIIRLPFWEISPATTSNLRGLRL